MNIRNEKFPFGERPTERTFAVIAATLLFVLYYSMELTSFPLFHIIDKMIGSALLFSIFMMTWNARAYLDNGYLKFIGISFLFVGIFDLLSPLDYTGIPALPVINGDIATQFWVFSRLFQSALLLIAPVFLRRKVSTPSLMAFLVGFSAFIIYLIFARYFPGVYREDTGTTGFKVFGEYAVIICYAAAMALLFRYRKEFDAGVFRLLFLSMFCAAAETLTFQAQNSTFEVSNFLGHYFETVSYYLVYRAIVVTGLMRPYDLLFRNLNQSRQLLEKNEKELENHRQRLEELVSSRTAELKESEEKLRAIFDNASDGILLLDLEDMRFKACNRSACEMLGYSQDEFACLSVKDIHPDDHLPVIEETILRIARGEMRLAVDVPVKKRDGGIFYVDISSSPPLLLNNRRHLIGIFRDITERKRAEAERARLVAAVESAADAIAITDADGITRYVNPAFTKVTGYLREDVIDRRIRISTGDWGVGDQDMNKKIWETLRDGRTWSGHITNRKKDGTLYEEEVSISPVLDAEGKIVNFVFVKRDITEKLRLEAVAEAVNMMNNTGYIFSGIRHEIGNPVNSTKMTLSVLKAGLENYSKDEIRGYLDRSLGEIAKIEYLLKSMKSFNMFENPKPQDIVIADFISKFVDLVKSDFREKGIEVSASIQADAVSCHADPRALQQVLLNIMTNAADACAGQTGARVSIAISKESDMILFMITDNGRGMTKDDMKDLFRPFFTSKPQGTGLGLVIAKKMITKMKGTISITSSKGEGSQISILLPKGKADADRI